MAIIKIKTIKNNLEAVINYARNGEKTENGILVSGVNCVPEKAYNQMALTKKYFHKETGRQGYHIIQSFNGKELTPKEANEIGVRLAEELFEDKFQVLVCTHINKKNVHNHIVLNSVSFADGSKYHNSKVDIALLKNKSDDLCKIYDLGTIKSSKATKMNDVYDKRISKYSRSNKKMLQIKNDIDTAILNNNKITNFLNELTNKGYEIIDKSGVYFNVKTPYFSRNVRLDRAFGEDYTYHNIQDIIYASEKENTTSNAISKKYYKKIYKGPKIDKIKLKTSTFYRSYVRWLYKLGKLPPKIEYIELTPEYFKQRQEVKNMREEARFIARHYIKDVEDLVMAEVWFGLKLSQAKSRRENLWKQHKKAETPEDKYKVKIKIEKATKEVDMYRKELKICNRISKRYEEMKEEMQVVREKELAKFIKNSRNRGLIR